MKCLSKIFYLFILIFIVSINTYAQNDSAISHVRLKLRSKEGLDTSRFNIFPKLYNKKKISLVLSGGGARGIAQIGVIKSLEDNNIPIDFIVGTSIGSVVGGLYSSGYKSDELTTIVKTLDWENILTLSNKYQRESLFLDQKKFQDKSLITIPLDKFIPVLPSSISSGQQIAEMLNLLFVNARYKPRNSFSDLKYPFYAVTTDFDKGEKVILNNGNISQAVKASITFPLLYTPTKIGKRNLVDGGLTANIPLSVAKNLGADIIIAVNTTSPLKTPKELENPINIADQILSITMSQLNEQQINLGGITITPDIGNHQLYDFSNADKLIKKGYEKTSLFAEKIRKLIDSAEISSSEYYNNFIINPEIIIDDINIPDSMKNQIYDKQRNKFVKFTEIENSLRMFYDMGIYNDVYAIIQRIDNTPYIRYCFEINPVLRGIEVNTYYLYQDSILNEFINDNKEKPVNSKKILELYENLLGNFRSRNISLIDIERLYIDSDGIIHIDFSKGTIEKIEIEGNKKTSPDIIFRELFLNTDKIVLKSDVEKSLENIFSTNLFQQLSFNFKYNNNNPNPDLQINLIEKTSQNFRFSTRADNERNLQLYFDLRDENIFGTGNEIGISAAGGLRNREYKFEIRSNRFFSTYLTYCFSAYYKSRNYYEYRQIIDIAANSYIRERTEEYQDSRYGICLLLGTQLERLGTVYADISLENLNLKKISNVFALLNDFNVIKLKIGGKIDSQDKYPFPTKGTVMNYYYETSYNYKYPDYSYSKLTIEYEQYFSIGKLHVLRPQLVFGYADKTTPLQEYFSLGGENSFLGMVEDELRGGQLLYTSLEYRFHLPVKIFFNTYLSLKYCLGRIWEKADDIRFKDLRHGLGASVQFDTPIGKASFSVGRTLIINRGLNEDSFILGPYTFYFSIGYNLN